MDHKTVNNIRNRAHFLRHLADSAEREYVAPTEETGDDEKVDPLHERLRDAAKSQFVLARELENLIDMWEHCNDEHDDVIKDAKSEEWYDDAYQGFCGG